MTSTKLILVKPAIDGDLDGYRYHTGVYADTLTGLCQFALKFKDTPMDFWDIWTDYGSERSYQSPTQKHIMDVAEKEQYNLLYYNVWYERWAIMPVGMPFQTLESYIAQHINAEEPSSNVLVHYEDTTRECPMCHRIGTIMFNPSEWNHYQSWKGKKLNIQDAFPSWSPVEREFLQTGLCPECQKLLFHTKVSPSTRLSYKK